MMEDRVGFEPTANGLKSRCTTVVLPVHKEPASVSSDGAPGTESNLQPHLYERRALPFELQGRSSVRPSLFG